jgi:hypothetical protein
MQGRCDASGFRPSVKADRRNTGTCSTPNPNQRVTFAENC